MDSLTVGLGALAVLVFGLFSGRLQRSIITPPMAFIGFGVLVGGMGLGLINESFEPTIHLLAEITLVFVLYTDAARIDLRALRAHHDLPVRLLTIGLPLTIGLGTLVAALIFGEFSIFEAGLLAAILAPTDAALGQAVVSHDKVPTRIKQALNVESGLNDGIAFPAVLVLFCFARIHHEAQSTADFLQFAALQVTLGPLVGGGIAYIGGRAVDLAAGRGFMNEAFRDLSVLALALLSFTAAEGVGGNGFIAAFVGGLVLGSTTQGHCQNLYDFAESEGQLLTLMTFTLFGAVMLGEAQAHFSLALLLYSLLSLTIVRMLPVVVALLGKGLKLPTVAFLAWFGPRGLASVLFVLLISQEGKLPHGDTIYAAVVLTVLLSTLLHGMTAYPLSNLLAKYLEERGSEVPEHKEVNELPVRYSGRNSPTRS